VSVSIDTLNPARTPTTEPVSDLNEWDRQNPQPWLLDWLRVAYRYKHPDRAAEADAFVDFCREFLKDLYPQRLETAPGNTLVVLNNHRTVAVLPTAARYDKPLDSVQADPQTTRQVF
jgi:hypothetical protein